MIDQDLKERDVQSLNDANALAEFFTKLRYNTSDRLTQSPAHLGIAESLHPDINKCERVADQESFLQVYLFELRSVTVAATKTIARALKNKVGNYLLVLTSDYERIDFVLLERMRPEQEDRERRTPTLTQANVRPRVLTVNRRKPTKVDLRVLRRFTYTETDAFAQYDKLVSAFNIADWSEEEFNNRALFSDYYLKERLPTEKEWRDDPKPSFLKLSELFEDARDKWSNQPEKQVRAGLLQPTFEVLGFAFRAGKRAGDDKAEPDYFLFESGDHAEDKKPLALCLAYPWERYLDGKDYTRDAESPEENPGQLVLSLLQREEADWTIVTNGKVWRLYSAKTHSRASNYYEVDLDEVLRERDPEMFRYFWLLFRAQAFAKRTVTVEGQERETTFVEQLLEGSRQYAKELGERLKERVFSNIFPHFARGFIEYRRNSPGIGEPAQKPLFDDAGQLLLKAEAGETYLNDIYQATLTFLYRLLFLLYSESRDLLPVKEERGYWEKSLTRLKNEVAEAGGPEEEGRKKNLEKHYSKTSTQLYDRLLALFRVIDKGQAAINVPRYNGGLFITEPRSDDASDEARHARLLNENKIPDAYLALGLDLLARDEDTRTFKLVPIDYKSLGVRHLGSIYEGLLEFRLRIAPEKMAVCRGKGKSELILPYAEAQKKSVKILTAGRGKNAVERTLAKGAVYLENDRHERKATGSYYTPDYIVKYIVENTVGPVLQEKFERLTPKLREAQRRQRQQQRHAEQKKKVSPFSAPEKSREAVLKTYRPLLDELFDVKVLDPAMGSGHFLVEAVDFITDRLIDFLNAFPWNPVRVLLEEMRETILSQMNEQGIAIDRGKLTDVNLLKRHVLKRCIYGVDLNPMAVELAKVSLWLDCFTLGAPLSFLDHHLKCGNSLLGTRIDTVKKEVEKDLFGGQFAGLLQATQSMIHVGELSDVTPEQVQESRASFLNASHILEPFKEVLDLWTSQHFGNKDARNLFLSGGFPEIRRGWQKAIGAKAQEAVANAQAVARDKRFFHWELEFPEVFFEKGREKENPGFDAVVGNPPYRKADDDVTWQELRYQIMSTGMFETLHQKWDLYIPFVELASRLVRRKARFSMIVENSLELAPYAEKCRVHLFKKNRLDEILSFTGLFLFEDAGVQNTVFVCTRITPSLPYSPKRRIHRNAIAPWESTELPYREFSSSEIAFRMEASAVDVGKNSMALGKICYVNKGATLQSHDTKHRGEFIKDELISETKDEKHPKPYVEGKYISDIIPDKILYLEYGPGTRNPSRVMEPRFPEMFDNHKLIFGKSSGVIIDFQRLWCDQSGRVAVPFVLLSNCTAKSVLQQINGAALEESKNYDLRYLLCIARSSIGRWYLTHSSTDTRDITPDTIKRLPIPRIAFNTPERRKALAEQAGTLYEQYIWSAATVSPPELTQSTHSTGKGGESLAAGSTQSAHSKAEILAFVEEQLAHDPERSDVVHDLLAFLAEEMIRLNKEKQAEIKRFLGWLEQKVGVKEGIESLAGKTTIKNYLGDYQKNEPEKPFADILTVLQKNKRKLSRPVAMSDTKVAAELEQEYEASLANLFPIKQKLALTDRLIDEIVYKLYGLTEEEIAIVEGRSN